MRTAPLTTVRGGINRLRTKGGARADTLYDLLNGYATESGTVRSRPGTTRVATLDSRTRGLCAFGGSLHTFCHEVVTVPDGYTLSVLQHPDPPEADYAYADAYDPYAAYTPVPLHKIHFSEPFLGGLYVAAEFEDGSVYHYWLRPGSTWEANTTYERGALVQPSVPNGILYEASRYGDPYPPWQADEPRSDGSDGYEQSIIEPTTYNGFYYVCIETQGPNPRSGTVEPTWPTEEGFTVTERTDTGLTDPAAIDAPVAPPAGATAVETSTASPATNPYDRFGLSESTFNPDVQYNIP